MRFSSIEDHQRAVETLIGFIRLRSQSAKSQLRGEIGPTHRAQMSNKNVVDDSHLDLRTLGAFDDLRESKT